MQSSASTMNLYGLCALCTRYIYEKCTVSSYTGMLVFKVELSLQAAQVSEMPVILVFDAVEICMRASRYAFAPFTLGFEASPFIGMVFRLWN